MRGSKNFTSSHAVLESSPYLPLHTPTPEYFVDFVTVLKQNTAISEEIS